MNNSLYILKHLCPKKSAKRQGTRKSVFKNIYKTEEMWYNLRGAGRHDIALPLQNKDSLLHGNSSMFRRSVV